MLCFVLTFFTSAAGAAVRVAVVPGIGDRSPDDRQVVQWETALSEAVGVTLLERAEVRRILREHELSVAGLADPITRVRMGELLAVEMFLFIEQIGGADSIGCRVQVIESRTGIVLLTELSGVGAQDEEEAVPDRVKKAVALALAKQRVSAEKRHYVSVLGFRNEELGYALDGLADSLWFTLSADLERIPKVILLDREHLQWLTQEEVLADLALELKGSSILIDGGIRNGEEADRLCVTLLFRQLNGVAEHAVLETPGNDLSTVRARVLAAIVERLHVADVEDAPVDPDREAALFMAQSKLLKHCGKRLAAIRAAEAAYALAPSRETRLCLIRALDPRVTSYPPVESIKIARGFSEPKESGQLHSLRLEVRYRKLVFEQYRAALAARKPGERLPWLKHEAFILREGGTAGLGLVLNEGKGETLTLQVEAAHWRRKTLDLIRQATKETPEQCEWLYVQAMDRAFKDLLFERPGDAPKKAEAFQEFVSLWVASQKLVEIQAWRDPSEA